MFFYLHKYFFYNLILVRRREKQPTELTNKKKKCKSLKNCFANDLAVSLRSMNATLYVL